MKIEEILPKPVHVIPFLNAGKGSGSFYEDQLPIHLARSRQLPHGLSAVVVTADLQGRERFQESRGQPIRLLGEALPQRLIEEVLPDLGHTDPAQVGVVLAGDFYTVPTLDKRGGTGDVSSVWRAFGQDFKWVAGVPGNHDLFGPNRETRPTAFASNMHFLDEEIRTISGLTLAGLGGIIGNPTKPQRRTEECYLAALSHLLAARPDVLILHDGPEGTLHGQPGNSWMNDIVERNPPSLVIRGHAHWSEPLATTSSGLQILNVDARVVIVEAI